MNRKQLVEQIFSKKSFLCVGLDTDISKMPQHIAEMEDPIFEFNKAIIDEICDIVPAIKPQAAYYEMYGWQGVKAVAAGAYHSVALMADGTVQAVGRSSEGQCDVAGWTGIVQIAAADYATLGLKADGTLVYTGFLGDMDLSAWTGLESICAGSYSFAAVKADGTALISHETARSEDFRELVALDVNTAYAVGVKNDGTVVSPAFPLEDWQDILTVSAGSTAVLGLDAGGHVRSCFFRSQDAVDFSSVTDAVALAAGGSHWAFVLADGSVKVYGETDKGQGDTGQWKLF